MTENIFMNFNTIAELQLAFECVLSLWSDSESHMHQISETPAAVSVSGRL